MRDSFVFYESFYDAISELRGDEYREAMDAVMGYALYDEIPDFENPNARMVFKLIKPQLDANNFRYECSKKGGAPKGNQNARKKPKTTSG